jgi:hypothetical protein
VGDGDGGGRGVAGEGDVDLGGPIPIGAQVPEVGEAARRVPDQDLAPVVLGAAGGALEDAAARAEANPGRAFPVKVTEFRPGQRMTWSGGMPLGLFKGVRTFTLAPGTDGSTRFTMREEYTGPLLPLIWRSMPDLGRRSASSPTA